MAALQKSSLPVIKNSELLIRNVSIIMVSPYHVLDNCVERSLECLWSSHSELRFLQIARSRSQGMMHFDLGCLYHATHLEAKSALSVINYTQNVILVVLM